MTTCERGRVKLSEILAVWESFSGWYWFMTEQHPDGLAFGLVRGHETEWGYFSLESAGIRGYATCMWPVNGPLAPPVG